MAETKEKKPKAPVADNPFAAKAPTHAPTERRKRSGQASEYKKSLQEKQAMKRLYGLSEKQFKRYVMAALDKMGRVENGSFSLKVRSSMSDFENDTLAS